jgi:hypothetical protein
VLVLTADRVAEKLGIERTGSVRMRAGISLAEAIRATPRSGACAAAAHARATFDPISGADAMANIAENQAALRSDVYQ